jgi:hypothetical protein
MMRMYISEQINSTLTTYRITNFTTRILPGTGGSTSSRSIQPLDRCCSTNISTNAITLRRFDQMCAFTTQKNRHSSFSKTTVSSTIPSSRTLSILDTALNHLSTSQISDTLRTSAKPTLSARPLSQHVPPEKVPPSLTRIICGHSMAHRGLQKTPCYQKKCCRSERRTRRRKNNKDEDGGVKEGQEEVEGQTLQSEMELASTKNVF